MLSVVFGTYYTLFESQGSMETYVDDYGNLYISVQRTIIKDKLTDMESKIMVYGFDHFGK